MPTFDFASELLAALDGHHLIELLSVRDQALDEHRAYAIAAEIAKRRSQRGETPVGRKIGFTNRNIWPEYNVWAPIWGHVYDTTVVEAPNGAATVPVRHLLQPRIEPEVVLHFARTPPATRDERAILECVDWIAHGFELVQCPFADWKFKAVDSIAAFGLHGALIIGPHIPTSDIDDCVNELRTFTIEIARNGVPQGSGGGGNVLDSPLLAFAHLAEVLAAQLPVQGGEVITTGTLTPAFPIAPAERWSTRIEGIGLPDLTLTLTA